MNDGKLQFVAKADKFFQFFLVCANIVNGGNDADTSLGI